MSEALSNLTLERSAARGTVARWCTVFTILAAGVVYLIGNGSVGLWDRDEPRYAQCSKQMLYGFAGPNGHGPDLVVPRYLDHLRPEKPPLIYWCQAAAMKIFGVNGFAARFPSALAMFLVLALIAIVLDRWLGSVQAAWTVLILASSALTIMSAKMCLTDAVLLLWISIALLGVFAVYQGNRSWWITFIIWIAVGLAGITKGPIVLGVIAVTLIALAILDWSVVVDRGALAGSDESENRPHTMLRSGDPLAYATPAATHPRRVNIGWWLALRPAAGILIIAAICGPWLWLVHERSPDFISLIFHRAQAHAIGGDEKHSAPPGFYLVTIWGLFFPWSMLLPMVAVVAWKNRRVDYVRYCLAAVLGIWILQECIKTKLPFYVLPAFPALALLTSDAILRGIRREHDHLFRFGFVLAATIWVLAICGMVIAMWSLTLPRFEIAELLPYWGMMVLTIAALIYAAVFFVLILMQRFAVGFAVMGIGAMAIFALIFTCFLPQAKFLQVSQQVAAVLRQNGATQPGDAIMIDYKEPSLAFYQGGTVVEERAAKYFEQTPSSQWPHWAVLPKSLWMAMTPDVKARLQQVGPTVHGLDYAGKVDGHRVVDVVVVRKKDSLNTAATPETR